MAMTKPTSEQVTFIAAGSGASQRTVIDKLRDVVSVKDFGAVGNGVTDDTAAFNNAVTAAGTRNVFVPGGSYKITGTVTGSFYSDATVTIVTGTVNTINRIGSVLSTTGNLSVGGTIVATSNLSVGGTSVATGTATATSAIVNAVQFPSTQVPSANVNTLDDYKEGTWTPTVSFGGASVGITYDTTNTAGQYVKIGRNVFAWGRVVLTSKGSSTGGATVSLPITSSSSTPLPTVAIGYYYQFSVSLTGGYVVLGTASFSPVYSGSNNTTNAQFTNSSDFLFSTFYIADN